MAIAGSLMDTPEDAIAIMQRLTRQEQTSYNVADAYKLDSIADWHSWVERATFELKGHAAKGAPHYMRLCRRQDVGLTLSDHGHTGQRAVASASNKPDVGWGRVLEWCWQWERHAVSDKHPTPTVQD